MGQARVDKNNPRLVLWKDDRKNQQRTFDTAEEAAEFVRNHNAKDGSITFKAFAEKWLERGSKWKTLHTIRSQRAVLNLHLYPAFGRKRVRDISYTDLLDMASSQETIPLASHCLATASAIFNQAIKEGLIEKNPAKGVAKDAGIDYDGKRVNIPDIAYDQMVQFTEMFAGKVVRHRYGNTEWRQQLALHYWILYGTGIRPGESLGLHIEQIQDGFLRIDRQYAHDDLTIRKLKHRKPGEGRDVPLPAWLRQKIDEHIEKFNITGYLFPEMVCKRRYHSAINTRGHRVMKKLGWRFIPYDLRHLYAAQMLANGMPIHELSNYMGHKDIRLTVNTYGFLLPGALKRGAEISERAYNEWKNNE